MAKAKLLIIAAGISRAVAVLFVVFIISNIFDYSAQAFPQKEKLTILVEAIRKVEFDEERQYIRFTADPRNPIAIVGLHMPGKDIRGNIEIPLTKEEKQALMELVGFFRPDGSYIVVTPERIDFHVSEIEQYVYSDKDRRPSYFHYDGDGIRIGVLSHVIINKLDNHWYYMFFH